MTGPYMLDTGTLIWTVASPDRLSRQARQAIKAGPLVLSVVIYWEIAIKVRKGLLHLADPVNWWSRAVAQIGGDILSVRTEHISTLAGLPEVHRDPFDRMLIAQAAAEGLAVISSDRVFQSYAVRTVW